MRWQVDTQAFKIGLLKIAYEFAVDSIGDYFETPDATEISRILREVDYEAVNRFVTVGSGLQPEVFEPFKDYLDLDSKKHYLVLINAGMELMGCVKLHRLFCVGVKLSSKQHMDAGRAIFGINDIVNHAFRKLDFQELVAECMGPTHSRLGFFLPRRRKRGVRPPRSTRPAIGMRPTAMATRFSSKATARLIRGRFPTWLPAGELQIVGKAAGLLLKSNFIRPTTCSSGPRDRAVCTAQ